MESKTFTREEAKDAIECVIKSIAITIAVCEVEFPNSRDILLEEMIGELEKMRSKPQEPEQGETNGPKPANDLMWTAAMMGSEDYKERFKAEYHQTKIRYDKLHKMCVQYKAGTLNFAPACELSLLEEQKAAMGKYLNCLEIRAQIEEIEL